MVQNFPTIARPHAALNTQAVLKINLAAVAANYHRLDTEVGPHVECSAVVKADAYGLGAIRIAPALAAVGCRQFFVATFEEAIALFEALGPLFSARNLKLAVFGGLAPYVDVEDYARHGIMPVLNSLAEIERWQEGAERLNRSLPAMLHIDTGLNRLGMTANDLKAFLDDRASYQGLDLHGVMSHLACADTPDHEMNAAQIAAFRDIRKNLPGVPASFANSAGIFLGPDYHFDMVRPGAGLYGLQPGKLSDVDMHNPLRFETMILQVKTLEAGATIGYGASYKLDKPARLATIAAGYADGLFRSLSDGGKVYIAGQAAPVVGRVSMDLVTVDITDIKGAVPVVGDAVEIMGRHQGADDLASHAGTIGYEVLTALGKRYQRQYI